MGSGKTSETCLLTDIALGEEASIAALDTDASTQHYLRSVGLREGDVVVVVRKGALGGPLHVRSQCGGDFALARDVAELIAVAPRAAQPALPALVLSGVRSGSQ
jgi:ferrous iron transport protein A